MAIALTWMVLRAYTWLWHIVSFQGAGGESVRRARSGAGGGRGGRRAQLRAAKRSRRAQPPSAATERNRPPPSVAARRPSGPGNARSHAPPPHASPQSGGSVGCAYGATRAYTAGLVINAILFFTWLLTVRAAAALPLRARARACARARGTAAKLLTTRPPKHQPSFIHGALTPRRSWAARASTERACAHKSGGGRVKDGL
jgi:hypothetical protein